MDTSSMKNSVVGECYCWQKDLVFVQTIWSGQRDWARIWSKIRENRSILVWRK